MSDAPPCCALLLNGLLEGRPRVPIEFMEEMRMLYTIVSEKYTPLMIAAYLGHSNCVATLLRFAPLGYGARDSAVHLKEERGGRRRLSVWLVGFTKLNL